MRVFGAMLVLGGGVVAVAAIIAAPRVLRMAVPLIREGARQGVVTLGRMRGGLSELAEDVEDWVAETRARRSATAERYTKASV